MGNLPAEGLTGCYFTRDLQEDLPRKNAVVEWFSAKKYSFYATSCDESAWSYFRQTALRKNASIDRNKSSVHWINSVRLPVCFRCDKQIYEYTLRHGKMGRVWRRHRILANGNAYISKKLLPWLFLWIMMMLPLIINSYNLVNFHQNLMKLFLNWRISHCLYFPEMFLFIFFKFFFLNLILERLWTWKNFRPDSIRVNLEVLKLLHLCMDCHEVCFKW